MTGRAGAADSRRVKLRRTAAGHNSTTSPAELELAGQGRVSLSRCSDRRRASKGWSSSLMPPRLSKADIGSESR